MDAETEEKLTETLKSSKDESETRVMDNKAKSVLRFIRKQSLCLSLT